MTSNVQAIGLGRIVVNSALNQPFDAEISIASIEDDVLESLEIKLATDSDFRRANIPIEPVVKSLQFNVINGETGPWIRVSTDNPVRIPFLHFLAAIGWSGGKRSEERRVGKEYSRIYGLARPAGLRHCSWPVNCIAKYDWPAGNTAR